MKKPIIKEKEAIKYIEYLESRLLMFEKSPHVKTYLTLHSQLESFNDQLTIKTEEGKTTGVVDLFGEATDKSFDRTKWYFDKILDLNKNLDELRKMMDVGGVKELEKQLAYDSLPMAERMALKHKNG